MNPLTFCPQGPDWSIDWDAFSSQKFPWIRSLEETPQNPRWHAEGDVWRHTQMVLEALVKNDSWRKRSLNDRVTVFMAALLHDIGKPSCTRVENGRITSPKHGLKGAFLARKILWNDFALSGTEELLNLRERIVAMVRVHSLPYKWIDREDPMSDVVRVSQVLVNEELALLSESDIRGRIAKRQSESLEIIKQYKIYAKENECFEGPFPFASDYSRYAYFAGNLEHPSQELDDASWGEIVLLSGLPASGKDDYVKRHLSHLKMISLDEIRNQLGLTWTDPQSPVVQEAKERAKTLLRSETPFVWNATNFSRELRQTLVRLFTSYGARVRIVYLETEIPTLLQRNRKRERPVSETAIFKMLEKLEVPTILEAHQVQRFVT